MRCFHSLSLSHHRHTASCMFAKPHVNIIFWWISMSRGASKYQHINISQSGISFMCEKLRFLFSCQRSSAPSIKVYQVKFDLGEKKSFTSQYCRSESVYDAHGKGAVCSRKFPLRFVFLAQFRRMWREEKCETESFHIFYCHFKQSSSFKSTWAIRKRERRERALSDCVLEERKTKLSSSLFIARFVKWERDASNLARDSFEKKEKSFTGRVMRQWRSFA